MKTEIMGLEFLEKQSESDKQIPEKRAEYCKCQTEIFFKMLELKNEQNKKIGKLSYH